MRPFIAAAAALLSLASALPSGPVSGPDSVLATRDDTALTTERAPAPGAKSASSDPVVARQWPPWTRYVEFWPSEEVMYNYGFQFIFVTPVGGDTYTVGFRHMDGSNGPGTTFTFTPDGGEAITSVLTGGTSATHEVQKGPGGYTLVIAP